MEEISFNDQSAITLNVWNNCGNCRYSSHCDFPAQALSFGFNFDNTIGGGVTPPFVGTGTFSFDGSVADGTYSLLDLTNFDFSFSFGTDTFANSDIATPLSEILVLISNSGQQANFSNINLFGSGPFIGSIDFLNLSNSSETRLSFEPPGLLRFGGNLDLYFTDSFFGNYTAPAPATAIPTPALLPGLIGMGVAALRQKRKGEAAEQAVEPTKV